MQKPMLQTHSSFVSVYRELKHQADPDDCVKSGNSVETLSWLADLQAQAVPTKDLKKTSEPTDLNKAQDDLLTDWSLAEKFWRPDEVEEDFFQLRSFVRGDCKSQHLAAKRKLKLRLFT